MSSRTRNLTAIEIELMFRSLTGEFALRNSVLFELGLKTGFRVSEIISLRIKDVMEFGKIKSYIKVEAKFMKNKKKSREVAVKESLKETLAAYIPTLGTDPDLFLFPSREGNNQPLTRQGVRHVLIKLKQILQLEGSLGTHCMRKTFATDIWEISGHDLYEVMLALGHDSMDTTKAYLPNILNEVMEKYKQSDRGEYGHYKAKLRSVG
jgi:site-specific recombinase XerD